MSPRSRSKKEHRRSRQTHDPGHRRLHAKCQFVVGDESFDARVDGDVPQMALIHFLNQVELRTLQARIHSRVTEIGYNGLRDGNLGRPDRRPLMSGRQKCTAVILHATVAPRRRDREESWQVVAFASQSIADPGTDTWPHEIRLPGM